MPINAYHSFWWIPTQCRSTYWTHAWKSMVQKYDFWQNDSYENLDIFSLIHVGCSIFIDSEIVTFVREFPSAILLYFRSLCKRKCSTATKGERTRCSGETSGRGYHFRDHIELLTHVLLNIFVYFTPPKFLSCEAFIVKSLLQAQVSIRIITVHRYGDGPLYREY